MAESGRDKGGMAYYDTDTRVAYSRSYSEQAPFVHSSPSSQQWLPRTGGWVDSPRSKRFLAKLPAFVVGLCVGLLVSMGVMRLYSESFSIAGSLPTSRKFTSVTVVGLDPLRRYNFPVGNGGCYGTDCPHATDAVPGGSAGSVPAIAVVPQPSDSSGQTSPDSRAEAKLGKEPVDGVGMISGLTSLAQLTDATRVGPPFIKKDIRDRVLSLAREEGLLSGEAAPSGAPAEDAGASAGASSNASDAVVAEPPRSATPRVALLFLTRGPMRHEALWDRFLKGHEGKYSVYVHAPPGWRYDDKNSITNLFRGRELAGSDWVQWGGISVIDAERRLLQAALNDPTLDGDGRRVSNERFVLLSESCIPIRNFTFTYDYLMASNNHSFLDSFIDVNSRYNPAMDPIIPPDKWRKGSQWFALTREHAQLAAEDTYYYKEFAAKCQVSMTWCCPDEHYVQTLFSMLGREDELERRSLTYADWWPITRAHPKEFVVQEAGRDLIQKLQNQTSFYRPLEKQNVECQVGGRQAPCWLFARKFSEKSGKRIEIYAKEVIGYRKRRHRSRH
eukprot:jgi/Mesvir1/23498/Mv22340-RA.1